MSDASGLFGLESVMFSVMPNPAAEVMHLQWPIWLSMLNFASSTLQEEPCSNNQSRAILLDDGCVAWAAGTYHVQLSASAGMEHASLVIQR